MCYGRSTSCKANMLFYAAALCLLYSGAIGVNAIRCYRTAFAQTSGESIGRQHAVDCKEGSVCMLAKVEMSIIDVSATLHSAFCFPKSEVNTTSCTDVLVNMEAVNAVGTGHTSLLSCRLSFCNEDLCNDMNGPTLPEHFPSATVVGEPVECYAIQKATTSIGIVNIDQVSKISCRAGARCFLSKVKTKARTVHGSYDINTISGGCKLAYYCDYDECQWAQDDLDTTLVNAAPTVESCRTGCCKGNLCNDADAGFLSRGSTGSKWSFTVLAGSVLSAGLWPRL